MVQFTREQMVRLHDPALREIAACSERVAEDVGGVDVVLLAGGFSTSLLLHQRVT